jgi:hypothetical protein
LPKIGGIGAAPADNSPAPFVPFRLNIDNIKTQWIVADESIKSLIAGAAKVLSLLHEG